MTMRLLVTDGETRAALAVVRALGARHQVFVAAAGPGSLAGLSRFAAGEYRQAPPAAPPAEQARAIRQLADERRVDRVIGVTDRTLTALHASGDAAWGGLLGEPHAAGYFRASDKVTLFTRCRELDIDVPEGAVWPGRGMPDSLEGYGGEAIARPARSWRYDEGAWVAGRAERVGSIGDLRRLVEHDPAYRHPYLLQRRLDGDGCGLFVLAEAGAILRAFSHRRLREKPPWGGVSTLCESADLPGDLLDATRRYVAAERWSGLAMFEFKRDRATGRPHLLEINARPWGSMALAEALGADFAAGLLQRPAATDWSYPDGVRMRWWWGDVDHHYLMLRDEHGPGAGSMLRAIWRALTRGPWPDVWSTFASNDPLPGCMETVRWLRPGRA